MFSRWLSLLLSIVLIAPAFAREMPNCPNCSAIRNNAKLKLKLTLKTVRPANHCLPVAGYRHHSRRTAGHRMIATGKAAPSAHCRRSATLCHTQERALAAGFELTFKPANFAPRISTNLAPNPLTPTLSSRSALEIRTAVPKEFSRCTILRV